MLQAQTGVLAYRSVAQVAFLLDRTWGVVLKRTFFRQRQCRPLGMFVHHNRVISIKVAWYLFFLMVISYSSSDEQLREFGILYLGLENANSPFPTSVRYTLESSISRDFCFTLSTMGS